MTALPADRLLALVAPIREALDRYDLGPNPGLADVRPVPELIAEADALCQQVRATHLRAAGKALPRLILELTHTVCTASATPAWQALASAYRTAHDVALKLDHPDLARVALDRMGWAAGRASDPCLEAVQRYKRATLWRCATSAQLITSGQALLAGETSREALAVTGQLHLGLATVAAKDQDRAAVEAHLAAARELADRVGGEAGDVHWLSFGRANVRLHELGTSIVLRDFDEALGRARWLKLPASTLTSRRARYLVDRALVEMEAARRRRRWRIWQRPGRWLRSRLGICRAPGPRFGGWCTCRDGPPKGWAGWLAGSGCSTHKSVSNPPLPRRQAGVTTR